MPQLRRLLFSDDFDPKEDTAVLNEILIELYTTISSKQSNNPAKCKVFRTTNQALTTGTLTAVSFDSENFNPDHMWDSGDPGKITFKESGTYLVTARVQWAGNATGLRLVEIRLGGVTRLARANDTPGHAGTFTQEVSVLHTFSVNDYIEVMCQQNSGGNLNIETLSSMTPVVEAIQLATSR